MCENNQNSPKKTSKYNGVYWHRNIQKWQAKICHPDFECHVGTFIHDKDAAIAINDKCLEFGIEPQNEITSEFIRFIDDTKDEVIRVIYIFVYLDFLFKLLEPTI